MGLVWGRRSRRRRERRDITRWFRRRERQRQRNGYGGTFVDPALYRQLARVQGDQALDDRQPEAGAFVPPLIGLAGLEEGIADRNAGDSVAILLDGSFAGGMNASGNATVTTVPSSILLCTVNSPACKPTRLFTIDSPRPVPSCRR